MATIMRYPLPRGSSFPLTLPQGAEILLIGKPAGERPALWALVDTTAPFEERHFRICDEGDILTDDEALVHVGSFIATPFSYHVFEVV